MRMYIANATHHVVSFLYRLPEIPGVRHQHIGIGNQIQLPEDLTQEGIDAIVSQHERYGLVPVDSVSSIKTFTGMCFSIDKPVPSVKIERLMEVNRNDLIEQGRKIREEAAVSTNNYAENQMEETGAPTTLRNFQMEIIEENPDPRSDTAPIAEGFKVQRQGDNQFASGGRHSRRRR